MPNNVDDALVEDAWAYPLVDPLSGWGFNTGDYWKGSIPFSRGQFDEMQVILGAIDPNPGNNALDSVEFYLQHSDKPALHALSSPSLPNPDPGNVAKIADSLGNDFVAVRILNGPNPTTVARIRIMVTKRGTVSPAEPFGVAIYGEGGGGPGSINIFDMIGNAYCNPILTGDVAPNVPYILEFQATVGQEFAPNTPYYIVMYSLSLPGDDDNGIFVQCLSGAHADRTWIGPIFGATTPLVGRNAWVQFDFLDFVPVPGAPTMGPYTTEEMYLAGGLFKPKTQLYNLSAANSWVRMYPVLWAVTSAEWNVYESYAIMDKSSYKPQKYPEPAMFGRAKQWRP